MSPSSPRKYAIAILKDNPERRMSATEIATEIIKRYPEICRKKQLESKQDLSSEKALITQIQSEIGTYLKGRTQEGIFLLPKDKNAGILRNLYYYSLKSIAQVEPISPPPAPPVVAPLPQPEKSHEFSEAALYPILGKWLKSQKIYSLRIDEKRSRNTKGQNGNQWLHPDLVGLQDIGDGLAPPVRDSMKVRRNLYSFEVKKELTTSNVRQSFFQCVSNSSWANFAYLVANKIEEAAQQELRLLCNSFGVGVIRISAPEEPILGDFVIQAAERANIDWMMVDRLYQENSDFQTYIQKINFFDKTKEIDSISWTHWMDR